MVEAEQVAEFHEEVGAEGAPDTEAKPEPTKLPPGYVEAGAYAATFAPPALPAFGRLTFKEPRYSAYMRFQRSRDDEDDTKCLALFLKACVSHCTTGAIKPDSKLDDLVTLVAGLSLSQGNALVDGIKAYSDQLARAKASAGNA